jgi:hypothetical protein
MDEMKNIYNDDIRQYLQMMQDNIERMASNSANCKTWMVTILSALMAIQCTIHDLNGWLLLGLLPIVLFWYMDVYYLHLERGMRNRETEFLNGIRNGNMENLKDTLYNFVPYMIKKKDLTEEQIKDGLVATNDRWFTKSILPFYGMALIAVFIITVILNWTLILGLFT